jgi:hypothetical protein
MEAIFNAKTTQKKETHVRCGVWYSFYTTSRGQHVSWCTNILANGASGNIPEAITTYRMFGEGKPWKMAKKR